MVPDFVNKFTDGKFFSSKDDDEIISEAKEEKNKEKITKVMGIGQFRKIHDHFVLRCLCRCIFW